MALTVTVNASFYESWLRASGQEIAAAMSRMFVDVGKVNPEVADKLLVAREVFVRTVHECLQVAPTPEQLARLGEVLAQLQRVRATAEPLTERGQVKLLVQRMRSESELGTLEVLDAS